MSNYALLTLSVAALTMAAPALAQAPSAGHLEKLRSFKSTGTAIDLPNIPQSGPKAEAIKKTLSQIKLA
jgi:hypothetical protein